MAKPDVVERVAEKLKAENLDKFSGEQLLGLVKSVTTAIENKTPATRKAVAQYANDRGIRLGAEVGTGDDATMIAEIIELELAK